MNIEDLAEEQKPKARGHALATGGKRLRRTLAVAIALAMALSAACLAGCAAGGQPSGSSSEAVSQTADAGRVVGIIGAMNDEVESLKSAADVQKTTVIASMEFCEGTLGDTPVVIVKCGMGKVNAGICAHTLINDFGCTEIINTGVAGSLDSQIDIGDIVVSTEAVQHDFDVEAIGFEKGEIPYTGLVAFPADGSLRAEAVSAVKETAPEIHVFEGRVCSGDQFISTKEQKDEIIANFGGLCCEMEGAAIAQTCYLNDVPYVVIRAISDKPDGAGAADYQAFEAQAAARCASIVEYMVENLEAPGTSE